MEDKFNVHSLVVSESPVIGLTGAISRQTIVRYHVGGHGPFQDVYDTAAYTPQKARAAIDKRVQELRTLTSGL